MGVGPLMGFLYGAANVAMAEGKERFLTCSSNLDLQFKLAIQILLLKVLLLNYRYLNHLF